VRIRKDWETSARIIIDIINHSAKNHPAKPRKVVLIIEDHRTASGAFDHDIWVLQNDIIVELLSPWLDEVNMPLASYRTNREKRSGDDVLPIRLERDGEYVRVVSELP
jgi:hypothetical protein